MYAHSIFMVPKSKADKTFLLFSIASSVQAEKSQKICLPLKTLVKRKKIGTGKSKVLAQAVMEEMDFLCGLVGSNEKEGTAKLNYWGSDNTENHPSTAKRGPCHKLQPID